MKNKMIDIAVEEASKDIPEYMNPKIEEYMKVYDKLLNTYIKKNIDYGDSFSKLYNKFGLQASVIRLFDKLNRLENLLENKNNVDESIEDTLEDLVNYGILTLMELRDNSENSLYEID